MTDTQYRTLLEKCRTLPKHDVYQFDDIVLNLLMTVLELQLRTPIVEKALSHFKANAASELMTFEQLTRFLETHRDDQYVAEYLWGNRYANRVGNLRALVRFFDTLGIRDINALRQWAQNATFERDFKGHVPNLGFAAFQWLTMRLGIDTVKPDVHVRRFVQQVTGLMLKDGELVAVLKRVAGDLGFKAAQLDAMIWHYQYEGC